MQPWTRNIGAPATGSIGCSSFATTPPLGILSTPAIDAQSRTIYVAGITGNASGVTAQIASAINADDGTVKSGWPVNVSTAASFDPKIHNQRSALSLVNGILYVPYGSYNGDCGSYNGRVVAINTANPTMVGQWQASDMGDGIWASGGLASDGNGVFAATGNTHPFGTVATHGDSEQVTRITGMGTKADYFYPTTWASMDKGDVRPGRRSIRWSSPCRARRRRSSSWRSRRTGKGYLLDPTSSAEPPAATAAGGQKLVHAGERRNVDPRRPGVLSDRDGNLRRHVDGQRQRLSGRRDRTPGGGGAHRREPAGGHDRLVRGSVRRRPARSRRPPTGRPTQSSGTRATTS